SFACSSISFAIKGRWSRAPCCSRRSGTITSTRRRMPWTCRSVGCDKRSTRTSRRRCCIRCAASATCWASMSKLLGSVAFRMALGYGVLVVATLAVISAALYFGSVVVIDRGIDAKLSKLSEQLVDRFGGGDVHALKRRIEQLVTDGIDQETEVFALLEAGGRNIVGNVRSLDRATPLDRLSVQTIIRDGRPSTSRLLPHRLSSGNVLVVGRDLHDVREME